MSKQLLYASTLKQPDQDLHEELLRGVEQIALAVGSTLGPRGRNVIIDKAGETPQVTKDGVTVARNIQLTDPVLNAAAKLVQGVARATVEEAGDGTTTATVLAHAILKAGLERVKAGDGAVALQRAIQAAVALVSSGITHMAAEPTDEQIAQVATISTNGNAVFGELILEAIKKVGRDGLITIDDANKPEMTVEVRDGFPIEAGFIAPEFITDREHNVAILENPYILITERQLSQGIGQAPMLHDPGPLLSFVAGLDRLAGNMRAREKRPLLILCDDVLAGSDAMQTFQINHSQDLVKICVVRVPGYGDLKRGTLADVAMATGGQVLKQDGGDLLSKWVINAKGGWTDKNLGQCKRVVVTNRRTILEGCPGDPNDAGLVESFAQSLRVQATELPDPAHREHLLQRAARLAGQVAVLKIGAHTEAEAKQLRDAAEDAVLAVRCAVTEGVVPGGGLCLYILAHQLETTAADMFPEFAQGARVVAEAMRAPLRLIAQNAGEDPDHITRTLNGLWEAGQVEGRKGPPLGFNAATGKFEDLVAAGIVDPAKVVRVALEKASSIAALMLTSSCLIYIDPNQSRATGAGSAQRG